MKVVYDISVLGDAHHFRVRTGIYRATEGMAEALARSGGCELAFTATESLRMLNFSRAYLRDTPSLASVPLVHPLAGQPALRGVAGALDAIDRRPNPRAPLKLARRLLISTLTGLEAGLGARTQWFPEADVFHSPFLPLPEQLGRASRLRRILSVHDVIPLLYPRWFDASVIRMMNRICDSVRADDRVVCHSNSTRDDLCECTGIDRERVHVVHLAAAPERFHPVREPERIAAMRRKYGLGDEPYLLSLNTLEPRKNMDVAIRAFVRLVRQEKLRDLRFVLVGGKGWKFQGILDAIADAGDVRDQIIMPGFVADEDLAALYSGSLAFVYPSSYEGFGLPPLEAMQCGVPVITSNASSLPEVVGGAGIMLDPMDADGLSQSMLDLYRSTSLRAEMRGRSLERAAQFSWDHFARETLAAYRAALAA